MENSPVLVSRSFHSAFHMQSFDLVEIPANKLFAKRGVNTIFSGMKNISAQGLEVAYFLALEGNCAPA